MANAQKWVRGFNDDVAQFKKSGMTVANVMSSMGVGGLAAAGSIAGLASQFKALADRVLDVKELGREIGVTTDQLRAMDRAGQHFGFDPSAMEGALKRLAGLMPILRRGGNNELTEALARAPELIAKIRGEAGDTAAVFKDIMGYVGKLQNPQDRIKFYEQIFGNGDLEKLNAEGVGGFDKEVEKARRALEPMTAAAAAQAQALRDAITDFNASVEKLELKVAPAVFSGLTKAANDFREAFGVIEKAYEWIEKNKDHPIEAAGKTALDAIDAQAKENQKHPEGIIFDVPGIVSKGLHAIMPDGIPALPRPAASPLPHPTSPPAVRQLYSDPRFEEDRATRVRDIGGPQRASTAPPPAFQVPPAYDREMRARKPADDLDGFVVGSLEKPILHLSGSLKTAAAQAETDGIKPAAFHPNGLIGPAGATDPQAMLAAGVKEGMLAAMREWAGGASSADSSTARSGIMPASFGGGGGSAAGGRRPSIRFGRQHSSAPYDDGGATPTGAHDPLKDLIAAHETGGTGAAGYDTVYGHAERGGALAPPKPITQMTIAEVLAYQRAMKPLARSSAFPVGRAQWTESTLRGLTRGMDPNTVLSPEVQEKLFDRSIAGRMGQGAGGFRSEWDSLRSVPDGEVDRALEGHRNALRTAAPGVANGPDGIAGHIRGSLKMGDETYAYGSGGVRGSAHVPYGDYPINPESGNPWGRAHNAMDVNGNGSIWDASLGRMRTGIEMHEAHSANMVTEGCLAFLKSQYPQIKQRVREMVAKTGHAYLHIGKEGATITPDWHDVNRPDLSAEKQKAEDRRERASRVEGGIDAHVHIHDGQVRSARVSSRGQIREAGITVRRAPQRTFTV